MGDVDMKEKHKLCPLFLSIVFQQTYDVLLQWAYDCLFN